MAEPVTGTKDQLQIVGMIEVPHMPAAGDKFMNQNIVNGKVIRMNCEVAKVIPSSDLATAIPTTRSCGFLTPKKLSLLSRSQKPPRTEAEALRYRKSSLAFGPYRKTNPQSAEDHKGDPGRKQMKSCGNHQNYSDQQGHIGPLDAIFGGHDTCPLHSRSRGQFTLIRLPLFRLLLHVLRLRGLCGFAQFD